MAKKRRLRKQGKLTENEPRNEVENGLKEIPVEAPVVEEAKPKKPRRKWLKKKDSEE
jgi:hypothetical protein